MSPSAATAAQARVLVVDDEPDLRTLYELTLLREGYQVDAASSLAEAWQQLEDKRFDAVITDMRLPDGLGLEILKGLQTRQRAERCVVMTAYGSAENAVEALKAGAFDYLTKPVDLKQFRGVVASAVQDPQRAGRAARPTVVMPIGALLGAGASSSGTAPLALRRMVGESPAMRNMKSRIEKVARSMAPVLVRGESGTGKELAARAIHACSHRAEGPFVAVNCGAIPENLLEAEFFGARKGSYTGATHDREGYFQAARGGTLFLDEIGDLPLAMQSKLLRAIQERSVRAIGSTQEETVDVRVVSATHRDLVADVKGGRFRQDLFYRLNVIEIALPPLRERREDLPALCASLLERIAQESGMRPPELSEAVLARLSSLPLRGNVRELENLLHRAVALSDGDEVHVDFDFVESLPATEDDFERVERLDAIRAANTAAVPSVTAGANASTGSQAWTPTTDAAARSAIAPKDLQAYLDAQEREILMRTLRETGFNRTAAASRLGLTLRQMRYRIARLRIPTPFGADESGESGDAGDSIDPDHAAP